MTQIIAPLPFTETNGTTADATQVMANFNRIRDDVNNNALAGNVSIFSVQRTSVYGVTANGTNIVMPARSFPIFFILEETAGHAPTNISVTPNAGIAVPLIVPAASSAMGTVFLNPSGGAQRGTLYFNALPVNVAISSTSWNSASINVHMYYVTLPTS